MHIPAGIMDKFFAGTRTDAIRFVINDSVRVISGQHAGRTGAVISIISIEPKVILLIEPGHPPWGDIEISQEALELLA